MHVLLKMDPWRVHLPCQLARRQKHDGRSLCAIVKKILLYVRYGDFSRLFCSMCLAVHCILIPLKIEGNMGSKWWKGIVKIWCLPGGAGRSRLGIGATKGGHLADPNHDSNCPKITCRVVFNQWRRIPALNFWG